MEFQSRSEKPTVNLDRFVGVSGLRNGYSPDQMPPKRSVFSYTMTLKLLDSNTLAPARPEGPAPTMHTVFIVETVVTKCGVVEHDERVQERFTQLRTPSHGHRLPAGRRRMTMQLWESCESWELQSRVFLHN